MTSKQKPVKSYMELAEEWEARAQVLFGAELFEMQRRQSEIERRRRMLNIKHDYKGYVYIPEEDKDEDNVKIKHVIWFGNRIKFHDTSHSPYSVMSRDDFEEFIDSHIERRMKKLMEVKSLLLEQSVELSMTGGSDEMAEKVEKCVAILDELYEEERSR